MEKVLMDLVYIAGSFLFIFVVMYSVACITVLLRCFYRRLFVREYTMTSDMDIVVIGWGKWSRIYAKKKIRRKTLYTGLRKGTRKTTTSGGKNLDRRE